MVKRNATVCACMMVMSAHAQPLLAAETNPSEPAQIVGTQASAAPVEPQSLYLGELPCADCAGVLYEIDLRERNFFFLRRTYRGKASAAPQYEYGRWSLATNQLVLSVLGEQARREVFAVTDATKLRKLDNTGKPIQSNLDYDLLRQDAYAPIEPTLRLQGMYSFRGNSESFTECLTGLTVPVAEEGGRGELRTAYSVARKEPGKFVFVEMAGRIALRLNVDGVTQRNILIVDKMGRFFPLRTCEVSAVTRDLETTRWVPVAIDSNPIIMAPQQREPFIVLQSSDHRVAGFGGCNRLSGGYELADNKIKFSKMAGTQMACEPGLDIEQRLQKALQATSAWRIRGDRLELLDSGAVVLAIFAARDL